MRNVTLYGLILSSLLFWACEDKFESGEFLPIEINFSDTIDTPTEGKIGKKGIFYPQIGNDWSAKVSSVYPHWHYSEASKVSIKEPGNVDFVPMIADASALNQEVIESLFEMKENGNLRYLIGFNEPENPDLANLTVEEALTLWPMLEQMDVPLSSPLCKDATGEWMIQFMEEVENLDLRVDYISVQWAGSDDVEAFFAKMDSIHMAYGKPIWLTKFTLVNTKLKNVLEFLEIVLPELENNDKIFRYAFESGVINTGTALWDDLGNLTTRGTLYSEHNPNNYISNGRDHWIDFSALENIITNGDFETGDLSGWEEGYGLEIVEGDANQGQFSGKGIATGWGSSFNQIFEVEPGATYYISFAVKFLEPIVEPDYFLTGLGMVLRDNSINEKFYTTGRINSTEWSTHSEQISIPENVTEVKIVMWRPNKSPEHLIDDIFFAKVE